MQTETQGVKSEYIQSRSAERQAGTLVRTRPNKNKLILPGSSFLIKMLKKLKVKGWKIFVNISKLRLGTKRKMETPWS